MAPLLWLTDSSAISDAALAPFVSWLGEGELARYERFTRPLRRRQFLIGRVLLRQALGNLLACAPNAIQLIEQAGAAPRLDWPGHAQIGLSISHSGPWVACAASLDTLLGLDIEVRDAGRDVASLAEQAFDPDDVAWLRARPDASRTTDFYDMWCAQEARIKLPAQQAQCIHVDHGVLAIALSSARVLARLPVLELRVIVA